MPIVVQQLTKKYGEQTAVNQISFQVGQGEIVGFLGPNGAGKSTTMKMLTGAIQPDSGNMEICGIPVSTENISTKKKIGYLPEANPLYPDMFIREYLSFIAGLHKISSPKKRIEEVIELVGLLPEANKKIGQLSKGYKQRTGFAAALLHNPEVLILDEPTSGLDPNQIVEIRDIIKRLGKEKTILFSTHILQEVEALCQRAIIINKGVIVADNTLNQLKSIQKGQQQLTVVFKEPMTIKSLQEKLGFGDIKQTASGELVILTNEPDVVRKKLMSFSVDNGLTIMSMHAGEAPLEEIFKSLTDKEQTVSE